MARRIRASRLSRYAEKQNKRQFLLFGLGTIIVIFLLLQFGGTIINAFGNIILGIRGEDFQVGQNSDIEEVLFPPNLANLPNATPSGEIDISGLANYKDGKVILYVNGRKEDTLTIDEEEFTFKRVRLQDGENILKVRYEKDNRQSDFSQEYKVIRSSEKPSIKIAQPANNSTFTKADKKIIIIGNTEPNNTVRINGFRAVVDSEGKFSYLYELKDGENKITVEAVNEAGLLSSEEITIIYRTE